MIHLHPLDRLRLQRGVEHLYSLGPRAQGEFFNELANRIGGLPAILGLLAEYESVSRGMLCAVGADRFPSRPLRVVPR